MASSSPSRERKKEINKERKKERKKEIKRERKKSVERRSCRLQTDCQIAIQDCVSN
jgi:hypothetical protein